MAFVESVEDEVTSLVNQLPCEQLITILEHRLVPLSKSRRYRNMISEPERENYRLDGWHLTDIMLDTLWEHLPVYLEILREVGAKTLADFLQPLGTGLFSLLLLVKL